METIVILSDQQARFNDLLTEHSVNQFLKDFQPDTLVNNGDLFDFAALSSYRKTLTEQASLMADVKAGVDILLDQRLACPKARHILIEGNHEERLTRYLLDHAEALSDAPGLTLPRFTGLDSLGVEYIGPYGAGFDWHGVLLYHGSRISPHSAYAAKAELLDAGTSGVSGHTHRLGAHYYTDRVESHVWLENGCLCNIRGPHAPPSERGPRVQNWQQGFTVGFYESGMWNLYQISITRHRFIWDGRMYEP
ncbi:MAG: metallophosphoesterase [Parcubacteria group bacterium]|nr:metallophosphoesterase [Parcubacteria group bacterium]